MRLKLCLLVFIYCLFFSCTTPTFNTCPKVTVRSPQCPFGRPVTIYKNAERKIAPILVTREQYTLAYDPDSRVPIWACETVSSNELGGSAERKNSISLDPLIPRKYQSASSVYTNSGYDRGHMIPAANQRWDQELSDKLFYVSNIAPMPRSFNRGVWRVFEGWIRGWAKTHEDAYVITGSFNVDADPVVIKKELVVPSHFYKILVSKRGTKEYHAIGFLFDIKSEYKSPYDWENQVVAIDLIEVMAGIDLMPSLSPYKETELELKAARFELWQ